MRYYDLGQAVADLTFQASALGLHVHQMGGFDPNAARELFAIPKGFDPVAMMALGYRRRPRGRPVDTHPQATVRFCFQRKLGSACINKSVNGSEIAIEAGGPRILCAVNAG